MFSYVHAYDLTKLLLFFVPLHSDDDTAYDCLLLIFNIMTIYFCT